MSECSKCGKPLITMSGNVYLYTDQEPYTNGVVENSKTDVQAIERTVSAEYCEYCDIIEDIDQS